VRIFQVIIREGDTIAEDSSYTQTVRAFSARYKKLSIILLATPHYVTELCTPFNAVQDISVLCKITAATSNENALESEISLFFVSLFTKHRGKQNW
jgi:hypothetical protein